MNNTPIVAMAYDFDGTLARGNIQENSFIPQLQLSKEEFWKEVKSLAKSKDMDEILSYMYLMLQKAKERGVSITQQDLKNHGKNIRYFNGVVEFLSGIKDKASRLGLALELYIISSGTREMIEGCSIAHHFKKIYASSFLYDALGNACWPALAINYTTKTQFLFRINKNILNVWDNKTINEYQEESKRRIPFSRMIYVGDGLTDVPAMKMTKYQGGYSIAVYDPQQTHLEQHQELLRQGRVQYIAPADYTDNSPLAQILLGILQKIAISERLENIGKN